MKQKNPYKNRHVLVLGLAKSGYYAAKLLHQLGAVVTVNDAADLANDANAIELEKQGIMVIGGSHPDNLLDVHFDLIVKNPGIPYSNPVLSKATKLQFPIITEIEVAASLMDAHLIGVTGTNGKTTTTSIIYEMIQRERRAGSAYAIGNIGVPGSQVALELTKDDDAIMELSSFQLMGTPTIRPEIAVITNLYSAHLDYHGSQEDYEEAKMNILANQTAEDYLIFNKDQPHLEKLVATHAKATLLPFSRLEYLEEGVCAFEGFIYFKGEKVAEVSDIFLKGLHNLENFLAAVGVAKLKGVSNETIREVMKHFTGVKHRTQYVTEFEGRIFYNDSKATNIEATEHALEGFSQPVVLLAGGLERGDTFETLVPALTSYVKALVTFGETADKLIVAAKQAGIQKIEKVADVSEAVPVAYDLSDAGDVILLSPAAASWDQYPNFEIRGEAYLEAIEKLIAENQE